MTLRLPPFGSRSSVIDQSRPEAKDLVASLDFSRDRPRSLDNGALKESNAPAPLSTASESGWSLYDAASGYLSYGGSRLGTGLKNSTAANAWFNGGPSDEALSGGANFTAMLVYSKDDSTSRTTSLFGIGGSTGADAATAFIYSGYLIYFWYGGSSGTHEITYTGFTLNPGEPHVFVFCASSRGMEIWGDGVLLAINTSTPSMTPSSSDFHLGGGGFTNTVDVATFNLFQLWDRGLSEEEIRALSADPWLLYRPQPIVLPAAGGGGTTIDQTAVGTVTVAALAGSVAYDVTVTQAAVGAVVVAGFAGNVNYGVNVAQTAVGTVVVAGLAGSVNYGVNVNQVAVGTVVVAGLAGSVSYDVNITQAAPGAVVVAGLSGSVSFDVTITQAAVGAVVVAGLAGSVNATIVISQSAVGTVVVQGYAGTVSTTGPVTITQTALGTVVIAGLDGTVTYVTAAIAETLVLETWATPVTLALDPLAQLTLTLDPFATAETLVLDPFATAETLTVDYDGSDPLDPTTLVLETYA
jgi:hypothetical protein